MVIERILIGLLSAVVLVGCGEPREPMTASGGSMEYCYRFAEEIDVDDAFRVFFEGVHSEYGGNYTVERQAYYYFDRPNAIYLIFYRIPNPFGRILYAYGEGVLEPAIRDQISSIDGAVDCSDEISSSLAI
jgi:hypothetical protein